MSSNDTELEDYILHHIDHEPEELRRLDRETHLYHLRPRMCSGHLQGRLLKMLVRMIKPQNVLELGTFTGYSALCLAEGLLSPEARVHTIEIDDELEDFIRTHFERSPLGKQIELHIGDACEIISQMGDMCFDLVFVDANKRHYVDYYNLVLPRVRQGGLSSPTTPSGMARWWIGARNSTTKRRVFSTSTTWWLKTRAWKP